VDDQALTAEPAPAGPVNPLEPTAPVFDRPGPMWRRVFLLVWPVLLQQWLVLCVPIFDTYLAGASSQLKGADQIASQAAQTTAGYLMWLITCYTVFVSVGSTALVARLVGAGDRRAARHAANQGLLLAVLLGLLGTALGLIGMPYLLEVLQLHGGSLAYAVAYLRPLILLLVFQMVEQAGIACLVGAGDTRTGSWILGGVAVVNMPLAWYFNQTFGFKGIALGTGVSHTLGALAVVAVLLRGRAGLRLRAELLLPDGRLLWRILRVSVPAGVDSMSLGVAQLWFLSVVNGLLDTAAAAHGIALRWEALGYQSGAAFGTVAMTLVGQYLGARQPVLAARAGWTAFALGGGLMTFMGVVFWALAPEMFRLSCPHPEQQPIIGVGVPVLRLVAVAMPALAATVILSSALRGAGDTRVPVLFTWFGFFVIRIPLAYVLTGSELDLGNWGAVPGGNLGLYGAWLAMCADLLVRGTFFVWRFAGGRWQKVRV
jgi:putative MATE family efflux protein